MNKREIQKEETLKDILRESEKLFQNKGFGNTTIQDIADKCGLSKGALYHHFRSKEEVLERICLEHYGEIKSAFLPVVEETGFSMAEKLKNIMTMARNSQMNTAAVTYKGRDGSKAIVDNPVLDSVFAKYNEKVYREVMAPLLEEGRSNGECRFTGSAEIMALFINSLDTALSGELHRILTNDTLDSPVATLDDAISGFTQCLSRLLQMDRETVSEITLEETMKSQYRTILEGRIKEKDQ